MGGPPADVRLVFRPWHWPYSRCNDLLCLLRAYYAEAKKKDDLAGAEHAPAAPPKQLPWQRYLSQTLRNSNLLYFSLLSFVQVRRTGRPPREGATGRRGHADARF